MIAEVGLKEKANAKSSTLSGGQKRKLSLGIALIGDSKVVILDGKIVHHIPPPLVLMHTLLFLRTNLWYGSLLSSFNLEHYPAQQERKSHSPNHSLHG